ncbi:MAG: TonB-dependent receptor, partial [Bacteroidetes bacterium]|nr:TonB-dependent receptor [Bacteroidota bacterium]
MQFADNSTRLNDLRVNVNLKYTIIKGLDANLYYQYVKGTSDNENLQSQETYYTRNLINKFTQGTPAGLTRPVPLGGILDRAINSFEGNNARLQFNYNKEWKNEQELNVIAGAELRSLNASTDYTRLYGYNSSRRSSVDVDYVSDFPIYYSAGVDKIPKAPQSFSTIDHYLSYYSNGVYTLKHRYILSGSIRRDEANIFGVSTNQKGVPLWSAGAAWVMSKEDFYRIDWLNYLKLRASYGYNGNVDRSLSSYTTIVINATNQYQAPAAVVVNPPNPELRWERIKTINFGADFGVRSGRVTGSIDYYIKSGIDLIGYSPIDPTTGVSNFKGNTSDMTGNGLDVQLNVRTNERPFRWTGNLLFSYTQDRIKNYKARPATISAYLTPGTLNPIEGKPLYSIFAYKWMGLDSQTGDPLGLLNGHASNSYSAITGSSNLRDLIYMGSATPTLFGSFRNTFSWKRFE